MALEQLLPRPSRSSGRSSPAEAKTLTVGGLAVTCNLTLPVACAANAAANKGGKSDFEYSKYSGWPEVKESLMAGDLQAAYMLAPLVMDLADKKIPVKIVSIGHRSGAVIMVAHGLALPEVPRPRRQARRDPQPLRGRLPVPAQDAGAGGHDDRRTSRSSRWPPPDMPAALYAKAVDAYCTGEPFGAAAQKAGYARVRCG